jgi:phospholipid/cholesterol/gamma-HCH transport system substrate-binding protein
MAGVLQSPLEGLFPDTETTIAELNKTLVAVQKLLGDEELKGGVTNLMESGAQTAQSFGRLAGTMDRELSRSAPKINRILDTVAVSLSEMQVVATRIREVADDPKLKEEATKLLASLGEAANQGQLLVQDLRRTTNDPELQASLKATLKNFETMSDSGTRIAADAERMATNGVAISEEVKTLMGKANKLADEVEKLVGDAKKGIERFTGPGGSASLLPEIGVETDLIYQVEPNLFRIDANVLLPAGQETIVFGLYDAFESNKINLQLDRQIDQRLGLRYGVYASKPGLGVSYAFAPNVRLRGDLYGLNDTQFDLRLRYDFSGGVHLWGGVEGIFGRNAPAIGIGIKR